MVQAGAGGDACLVTRRRALGRRTDSRYEAVVGLQLALFDGVDCAPPTPVPEPVEIAPAPVVEVVPGQTDLFGGPYRERHEAELACERLDGAALRAAHASARRSYPTWEPAWRWPRWADGLDALEAADLDLRVARALALERDAADRFPGMPSAQLAMVRREALTRAACAALQARGPAARVAGRLPGELLLEAGRVEQARAALQAAAEIVPRDGAVRAVLGWACFRAGGVDEAVAAWRDACLLDPVSLDERDLPPVVTDLLDLAGDLEDLVGGPRDWLPVLADLTGAAPLPPWAAPAPREATAARRCAALLRAYRDEQASGASPEQRRALKREMIALAPALREHVRRI